MTKPTGRLTRHQRRALSRSQAAHEAREREGALPWRRAHRRIAGRVDRGELPPGCERVADAMARCHKELGKAVREHEIWIGYGAKGDKARLEARARSTAAPPVHLGIAEEARLSRRWAIHCMNLLAQAGEVKRWFGGPHQDYRENVQPVQQRANRAGERQERLQGLGGAGWANAYTVEGIPDPVSPDDEPPPAPRPPAGEPAPPEQNLEPWRRIREQLEADRVARLRRRAAEMAEGP